MFNTVLLVDDDQQFRQLAVQVLEQRQCKVFQASSGQQAWQLLGGTHPDLIIVDGVLPDVSGVDWIAELRLRGDTTPIIFISGHWWDPDTLQRLFREYGVSLFVHKPIIPEAFSEEVQFLLARSSTASPPGAEQDLQDELDKLRREYASKLPDKLDDLRRAVNAARERANESSLLNQAKSLAHKIRGTAGSYGFTTIGERVGKIEEALTLLEKEERQDASELWNRVGGDLAGAISEALSVSLRDPRSLESAPDSAVSTHRPSMARILLVDDDPEFLELARAMGRQRLIEIVTASHPEQALFEASTGNIDAAILDVSLGSTGFTFSLAGELRSLPGCQDLPVAFISADERIERRVTAAQMGAALFLSKPLEPEALEFAVHQLVSARQLGKPRVLVVDDDEDFSAGVELILRQAGMLTARLHDSTRILEKLNEFCPDLVLLDVLMPGLSGYDACMMLRTMPRWRDLPILFLTAETGWQSRSAIFKAGGDDYLTKPVMAEELLTRVKIRVERARLLKERADKDTITGLLLRRAFMEQLAPMLAEAVKHGWPLTIALLDLDHFKKVNDIHGHLSGDGVLAGLGRLLSRRFRMHDLKGRWGGEEFILAFSRQTRQSAHTAVERVLQEFAELSFPGEHGEEFHVAFSAGLASYPSDGASIHELIKKADGRLMAAKAAGRARVVSEG
ncbi:MAG TPA: response regulator [Candidatus Obscuribacterales bacterium]